MLDPLQFASTLVIAAAATLAQPVLPAAAPPPPVSVATSGFPPLSDLGAATYLGFTGGLYAAGTNTPPAAHAAVGALRAASLVPRDVNGNPSASGKIVLLSLGMSNATQEFCAASNPAPCDAWTFAGQAQHSIRQSPPTPNRARQRGYCPPVARHIPLASPSALGWKGRCLRC